MPASIDADETAAPLLPVKERVQEPEGPKRTREQMVGDESGPRARKMEPE
ncbi:MAG: hypothetical protein OXC26_18450 [Albidovulum sp.]|nr:hypothetical protein [Albidovulum sp.]